MIPNEAKSQFQDIITHEMFEMERALAGVLAATHSNMISRGLGTSGPAMQVLTQDATNSLKARAQPGRNALLAPPIPFRKRFISPSGTHS